ncbi:MAG: hypothetical protein A3I61_07175 [Acidobacteria bacterium RIFCSPLOWO2_02_FULL_68_18]|nr:MAG: hypothetical protein A3I61_07175 [Acidobacteria bacterium RIFCSPLOWO2_02_FULL_68_18]
MRTTLIALCAALGLVAAAAPARRHHSFAAEFDATKPIKLRGTVVKMEWINPHTWIHIEVRQPNGRVEAWAIEGGPPNALFRRGVTRDSLPTGADIVIEGFQAKDGSRKANGRDVTFADGRRLFLGSAGTGAPGEARGPAERR